MSEQYEVLAVRYGTRQASAAEVFLNYHAYREPDRSLGMDYFFWVARNPARTVLIDTGFSPAGGAVRGRTMLMDTVSARRAAGTAPGEVAHVVLTHVHYDQVGGLPVFTETDAEVIMTRDEYDFWTGPMGRRGQFEELERDRLVGAYTRCPAARSLLATGCQAHPPCHAPCTSTKFSVMVTSSSGRYPGRARRPGRAARRGPR
jgi:hypothetical protein